MATDADELDADIRHSLLQLHSLTDALDERLQQRAEQQKEHLRPAKLQAACSTTAVTDQDLHAAALRGLSGEQQQPSCAGVSRLSLISPSQGCAVSSTAAVQHCLTQASCTLASTNSPADAQGEQSAGTPELAVVATPHEQADGEVAHSASNSTSFWSQSSCNSLQWDSYLMALAYEQSVPVSVVDSERCASTHLARSQRNHVPAAAAAAATQQSLEGWRKNLQQAHGKELLFQQQAAQAAAAAASREAVSNQAAAWKQAKGFLPFKSAPSAIAGTQHKLHKSLSALVRDAGPAAAEAAAAAAAAVAAKAATDKVAAAISTAQAAAVKAGGSALQVPAVQPSMACLSTVRIAHPTASVTVATSEELGSAIADKRALTAPVVAEEMPAATAGSASCTKSARQKPAQMSLLDMHLKQQQEQHQKQHLQRRQQQTAANAVSTAPGKDSASIDSRPAGGAASGSGNCHRSSMPTLSPPQAVDASSPRKAGVRTGRTGLLDSSPRSKAAVWAAADAATDAEVDSYLRGHWQQQHLPAAALVLQCAWRSRGPRYMFHRRRHAVAALSASFRRWCHWALAGRHCKMTAQRNAFTAWQELIQLQLVLCNKVVRALQKGVLAADTAGLLMWRLCTPPDQYHIATVHPSLGGLLGSILKQRAPQMRLKAAFAAWHDVCEFMMATRRKVQAHLAKAALHWRQIWLKNGLRFWHTYTVARRCEALGIMLPAFRPRSLYFEEWLWQHERRRQLRQHAAALYHKMCLRHFLGSWHAHCFKVHTMRVAWSGLVLHSTPQLLHGGMSAFKANWKEMRLQRMLLGSCFAEWQLVAKNNKAVSMMRRRIEQATDYRVKTSAISAFRKYSRMSQLLSAAGVLKIWQSRPLALAHVHAWLGDTLHMTLYLCWWRWKGKAVARVRLRAALGVHMYKAHWLDLELAFTGWRKAAAAARAAKPQEQQNAPQLQRKYTGAAALVVVCDDAEPANGMPPTTSTVVLPAAEVVGMAGAAATAFASNAVLDLSTSVVRSQTANDQLPILASPLSAARLATEQAGEGWSSAAADQQQIDAQQGRKEQQEQEYQVFVSLADYPTVLPWRPLARRADVMANQGLQHMSGARLAKAVRDVRELEGVYIVKDNERGSEGLLNSMVFVRRAVSPGLQAIVTAQLPMEVLWHFACTEDATWWQRIVGLVEQRLPHPDSWRWLISSYSSTCSNRSFAKKPSDLHEFLHSSDGRVAASPSTMQNGLGAKRAVAASRALGQQMYDAGRSPTRPTRMAHPQLPGNTNNEDTQCVKTKHSSTVLVSSQSNEWQAFAAGSIDSSSPSKGIAGSSLTTDANEAECAAWPETWGAKDVAWLCQLAQAEELLETAVHLLLGIGSDSSEELYQKLRQSTQGQNLYLQGDLLAWLLSTAIAHDTAQAHKVLLRARARDKLLDATMELRERARALHLHFPLKFTLSTAGPVMDSRAMWAAIIARVESERDWDVSSTCGSDDESYSALWLSLMQHQRASDAGMTSRAWPLEQPQVEQQQQWPQQQQQQGGTELWDQVNPEATAELAEIAQWQSSIPLGMSEAQIGAAGDATEQGAAAEPSELPPAMSQLSIVSTGTAAAVAIAAAAAAAGSGFESASLSPGGMLSCRMDSGELQLYRTSRASTPTGDTQQQQQQHIGSPLQQHDLMAVQKAKKRKERAEQKQQQQQQASIAAAVGLFAGAISGTTAVSPAATAASEVATTFAIEDEIFAGPPAFGLSALNSARSSKAVLTLATSRISGAVAAVVSSADAAAGETDRQMQQQQTQSGHGWHTFAFKPNAFWDNTMAAMYVSSGSTGGAQQRSSSTAETGRPPLRCATVADGITSDMRRTAHLSTSRPSSSSRASGGSASGELAASSSRSLSKGSSSSYRMSSSGRPSSSSRLGSSSSSRPDGGPCRPASAGTQPSSGPRTQSSTRADATYQSAGNRKAVHIITPQATGTTYRCKTDGEEAMLSKGINSSMLFVELKGVLEGVLTPEDDADSAAAALAREAAVDLADACASWLRQQQDEEAQGVVAALQLEAVFANSVHSSRVSSTASIRPSSRQQGEEGKLLQSSRSSTSLPDVDSHRHSSTQHPAAATTAVLTEPSSSKRAAAAVPRLAFGSLNSAVPSCSNGLAPAHAQAPGQLDVRSPAVSGTGTLNPTSTGRGHINSFPTTAAAAARQANALSQPAGLTVLSYCTAGSAGSSQVDLHTSDKINGSDSDDETKCLYQVGPNSHLVGAKRSQSARCQHHQQHWRQQQQLQAELTAVRQRQTFGGDDTESWQQQMQEQQQQRQLQLHESNCSTLSSLPSIPSCSDVLASMQQQKQHKHVKKKQQDSTFPAIATGIRSQRQQQQQQQQQSSSGSTQHSKLLNDMALAAAAANESVWHAPAPRKIGDVAVLQQYDTLAGSHPPQADALSILPDLDGPATQELLQEAGQDDWDEYKALATELELQLSAALHSTQAAATASRPAQLLPQRTWSKSVPDIQPQQQAVLPAAHSAAINLGMLSSSMQWEPAGMAAAAAAAGGDGVDATAAGRELSGVLAKLEAAPLAARLVFWKQLVTKQQQQQQQQQDQRDSSTGTCSSSSNNSNHHRIADQLHQFAWNSLLQQPAAKLLRMNARAAVVPAWSPDAAAVGAAVSHSEALRVKLQQYMQAYMQWHRQQGEADPLTPADKWPALEHEEQVLDFITSLTVSVYTDLLRKHWGMPASTITVAATKRASQPTAFGSSSVRLPTSRHGLEVGITAAAAATATVIAEGKALSTAKKPHPTIPREAKRKAGQVCVIPGPPNAAAFWQQHAENQLPPAALVTVMARRGRYASCSSHNISTGLATISSAADDAGLDNERLTVLQGWQVAGETPPTGAVHQHVAAGAPASPAWRGLAHTEPCTTAGSSPPDGLDMRHACLAVHPIRPVAFCGADVLASEEGSLGSCYSEASSWQLRD